MQDRLIAKLDSLVQHIPYFHTKKEINHREFNQLEVITMDIAYKTTQKFKLGR